VSKKFTWRLNNIFASEGDDFEKTYAPLVRLMFDFISNSPEIKQFIFDRLEDDDFGFAASQAETVKHLKRDPNKEIKLALNRYRMHNGGDSQDKGLLALRRDVQTVVKSKGVALVNAAGDVLEAPVMLDQVKVGTRDVREGPDSEMLTLAAAKVTARVKSHTMDFRYKEINQKGEFNTRVVSQDGSAESAEYASVRFATVELDLKGATEQQPPDPHERKNRSMVVSEMDTLPKEEFLQLAGRIQVRFSSSLKRDVSNSIHQANSRHAEVTKLLFGVIKKSRKKNGRDLFVVKEIKDDKGSYNEPDVGEHKLNRPILVEQEDSGNRYLGKWIIRYDPNWMDSDTPPPTEPDYDLGKDDFSDNALNAKSTVRERLIVVVSIPYRYKERDGSTVRSKGTYGTKIWGFPSEGSDKNKSLPVPMLLRRLKPLFYNLLEKNKTPIPFIDTRRLRKISPSGSKRVATSI